MFSIYKEASDNEQVICIETFKLIADNCDSISIIFLYILYMELFEQGNENSKENIKTVPLADRMRPQTLDDFVGQEKIVGKGTPLRKAIETDNVSSLIFW